MVKAKLCLDIGCGQNIQPGFVGMDKRKLPGVEIVHDIEVFPWPFKAGEASVIKMSHVVEHIKPWFQLDLINECWRVLAMGGTLAVSTPYGGSYRYFQDPTHCSPWVEATVAYFDPREPLWTIYEPKPWQIQDCYWKIYGDLEFTMIKIEEKGGGNGSN